VAGATKRRRVVFPEVKMPTDFPFKVIIGFWMIFSFSIMVFTKPLLHLFSGGTHHFSPREILIYRVLAAINGFGCLFYVLSWSK